MPDKIKIANGIISSALKKGKPCVLYSGGKDSTVLLDLVKKHCKDILVMYNDTTLSDPKAIDFIKSQTVGLNFVMTTADNPIEMWHNKGYYPILSKRGFTAYKKKYPNFKSSPVQCCYQLKEKYCNKVLKEKNIEVVFWGNRAGDSNRRKLGFVDNGFLFKPKKYNWWQCYPLQHFTDEDIILYLRKYVPNYPFFKEYESGCLCCGTDLTYKDNNLYRLYKANRSLWLKYMKCGFAEQILIVKGLSHLDVNEVIDKKPELLLRI